VEESAHHPPRKRVARTSGDAGRSFPETATGLRSCGHRTRKRCPGGETSGTRPVLEKHVTDGVMVEGPGGRRFPAGGSSRGAEARAEDPVLYLYVIDT